MTELERFRKWLKTAHEEIRTADLDIQLSAYTRTYPGRTLLFLAEMVKAHQILAHTVTEAKDIIANIGVALGALRNPND